MRQRARAVSGDFAIESSPAGTRVRLDVAAEPRPDDTEDDEEDVAP